MRKESPKIQTAPAANGGRTGQTKRKASPVRGLPLKKKRASDSESPKPVKGEDLRVRLLKKRCREDGERPSTEEERSRKRKRKRDPPQDDGEIPSSSTDTGDSSPRVERMASPEGEGPRKRRRKKVNTHKTSVLVSSDMFEAKYEQHGRLGEGGCGCVFAGYRKEDQLPVAIKRIPKDKVVCKHSDGNGREISVEIAIMEKLAAANRGSAETSAPVSLLDWYDLGHELVIVMERPVPAVDLWEYLNSRKDPLKEDEAKVIMKQLVDAAKHLEDLNIFHRDIKVENLLIETSSEVPRVRLIDFGLGCFTKKRSCYRVFYGTEAHSSPEWFRKLHYKPGPTTVWQMGVVMYELLHFKGSFNTVGYLHGRFPISKKLSTDCEDFLLACFTRNPKRRPTLAELQDHPWLR